MKTIRKSMLLGACLTLLLSSAKVLSEGSIKVGIPAEFPPYYSIGDNNEPYGFGIDVISELANTAGLSIRYFPYDSWRSTFNAMKEGRIQVIPNSGITEERKTYMNFTTPVEQFEVSVFVRSTSNELRTLDDLQGKTIGVVSSNVAVKILHQSSEYQLKEYLTLSDALFELLSGRIDGLAYPEPVVWKALNEIGLNQNVRKVSPSLTEVKRAIGIHPDHPEIHAKLQSALDNFYGTDKYHRIYDKWFNSNVAADTNTSNENHLMLFIVLVIFLATSILLYLKNRQLRALLKNVGKD